MFSATPQRKRSIDDADIHTASSPIRSAYKTPISLQHSGGAFSDNWALGDFDEAETPFRRRSYRPSIGSTRRLSMQDSGSKFSIASNERPNRFSIEKASPKANQKLSIEEIVFDDFKILKDDRSAVDDKEEALKRLGYIFSTEKGQPFIASLIEKLKAEHDALTREQRLMQLMKNIVRAMLLKKKQYFEYHWQRLSIEIAQGAKNSINSSISLMTSMAAISEIVPRVFEKEQNQELISFFNVKMKETRFTELLSGKTSEALEKTIQSMKNEQGSDEHAVLVVDCQSHIQEMLGFNHEQAQYGGSTETAAKNATEELRVYLENHPQLQDFDKLADSSTEELERLCATYENLFENIKDQTTAVDEQILECAENMGDILQGMTAHPTFKAKGTESSSIENIVNQPMRVMFADNDGKNSLDHAIECADLSLIAIILAKATSEGVLEELLHTTLLKLVNKNDRKAQLLLIGGAYLFDPENKGLLNSEFVKKIRGQQVSSSPVSHDGNDFMTRLGYLGDTPMQASKCAPSINFLSLFDKEGRHKLTSDELGSINNELLKQADDKNFARFIQDAGASEWPHDTPNRGDQIRDELRRRYIGEDKQNMPHDEVRAVLNKNLAIVDDAEALGTFFNRATRRVCVEYQRDPKFYASKIDVMLKKVETTAKNLPKHDPEALKEAAINIAIELTAENSTLNRTRPGTFAHRFNFVSETQKLVVTAKEALTGSRGWRSLIRLATPLTTLGRQDDGSILKPAAPFVDGELNEALLKRIPITPDEKEACMKRAALAQGVFKKTLDYLKTRPYGDDKKVIMDAFIQHYVDGYDENNQSYTAENLKKDLETAKENTEGLGKKLSWNWWRSPKTVRKLNADLANSDAFIALDKMTAAAAG